MADDVDAIVTIAGGHAIRRFLSDLTPNNAEEIDSELTVALEHAGDPMQTAQRVTHVLERWEGTSEWLQRFQESAPRQDYTAVLPGAPLHFSIELPPGRVSPVKTKTMFVCPQGDQYPQRVKGQAPGLCPVHHLQMHVVALPAK